MGDSSGTWATLLTVADRRLVKPRRSADVASCATMVIALLGCLTGSTAGCGGRGAAADVRRLGSPEGERDGVSIPFDSARFTGYPLVDVCADGHAGRFAFDTGGGRALIVTPGFAAAAAAVVEERTAARVNGRGAPSARFQRIRVGAAGGSVRDPTAAVLRLDAFSAVCGERVDGIIGAGALAGPGGAFEIDYPRGRVRLGMPTSSAASSSPEASSAALPIEPAPDPQGAGRPFVWLRIGGKRVPAVLDSCDYEAVRIPDHLLDGAGVTLTDARPSLGSIGFDAEPREGRRGRLASMTLGGVAIRDAEVQVLPDPGRTLTRAVIGTAVLRHYRLAFDPERGRLTLAGPRELNSPAPDRRAVAAAERILRW